MFLIYCTNLIYLFCLFFETVSQRPIFPSRSCKLFLRRKVRGETTTVNCPRPCCLGWLKLRQDNVDFWLIQIRGDYPLNMKTYVMCTVVFQNGDTPIVILGHLFYVV